MAQHNDIGSIGEALALRWLLENGYRILKKNWKSGRYEIDIIAAKRDRLHFVEVKTRQSDFYGHPEQSVTRKKFRHLTRAADEYMHRHPGFRHIQYDILSIIYREGREPTFFLLEDVFL